MTRPPADYPEVFLFGAEILEMCSLKFSDRQLGYLTFAQGQTQPIMPEIPHSRREPSRFGILQGIDELFFSKGNFQSASILPVA